MNESFNSHARGREKQPHRRDVLRGGMAGAAVVSLGAAAPRLLCGAAAEAADDGRVLVMVEMAGGNDGLNSVIPYRHEAYLRARPTLRIPEQEVLSVTNELGLHPSMRGFADLLEQGQFAVVQGVGYPNPNRSHFESMEIWHTCQRKEDARTDGWLGRYLETVADEINGDPAGLHLGSEEQPYALMSRDVRVPSIQSLEQFRLHGASAKRVSNLVRELSEPKLSEDNELLSFLQSSTTSALRTSEQMEAIAAQHRPAASYPSSELAKKLGVIAQMIKSGLGTKVFYVRIDGFDTHANQRAAHAVLLRQVSDAVTTFTQEMVAAGIGERVLTVCFSEFGRRVSENASEGTDHGTAGPVFVAGDSVRAGLIGEHPSLDQLERGDLVHHTDFRCVYAALLERWLGCPSTPLLKQRYQPVDLVKS